MTAPKRVAKKPAAEVMPPRPKRIYKKPSTEPLPPVDKSIGPIPNLRLGPCGEVNINKQSVEQRRLYATTNEFRFGFLWSHQLMAMGVYDPMRVDPDEESHFQRLAEHFGVETHFLRNSHHYFEDEAYQEPFRMYASSQGTATLVQHAARSGAKSYTLHAPPLLVQTRAGLRKVSASTWNEELELIRKASGDAASLIHVTNSPTKNWHLGTLDATLECAEDFDFGVTVNLLNWQVAERANATVDDYKDLFKRLPTNTLFVYGCTPRNVGGLTLMDYHAGLPATPPVRPFLHAVAETGRPTTTLVRGAHADASAIQVLTEACILQEMEPKQFLAQRAKKYGVFEADSLTSGKT